MLTLALPQFTPQEPSLAKRQPKSAQQMGEDCIPATELSTRTQRMAEARVHTRLLILRALLLSIVLGLGESRILPQTRCLASGATGTRGLSAVLNFGQIYYLTTHK